MAVATWDIHRHGILSFASVSVTSALHNYYHHVCLVIYLAAVIPICLQHMRRQCPVFPPSLVVQSARKGNRSKPANSLSNAVACELRKQCKYGF